MSKIHTILLVLLLVLASVCPAWGQEGDGSQTVRVVPLAFGGAEAPRHLFTTTFSLMNLSNTTIEVQVVAFADDREVDVIDSESGPVAAATIRLLPNQAVRRLLRPLADSELFPLRRAWLLVRGPAGSFAASARITALQVSAADSTRVEDVRPEMPEFDARIRSDVQIDALPPAPDLEALITWDGQRRCFPVAMSSYSLVNPNREAAEVRFRFVQYLSAGNRVVHEARRAIPGGTRVSLLLAQIFPELFPPRDTAACPDLPVHQTGILEMSADRPINVAALSVNLASGHFVDLPVRIVRQSIGGDE